MNLLYFAFGICTDDCTTLTIQLIALALLAAALLVTTIILAVLAYRNQQKRLTYGGLSIITLLTFLALFVY